MRATFLVGTAKRMQELVKEANTLTELKRIQSVLFGSLGMSAGDASHFVGYSKDYIRHFWSQFRKEGEISLKSNKGIGNRNRAHLSSKEEKAFLEPFFNQAKEGGILIVKDIHKAYEKQFQKVHHSVIYNLLKRYGWRKISPRPAHPNGKLLDQKIFKASFPPNRLAG